MANLNKVFLMGNLTRDPEIRYLDSGTAVCKFGIATNRTYRTQDGQQREDVCFVDVTAWARQAELISEYLSKGQPLFIEGRLQYEQWENKDGQRRNKLSVVVNNFQFLGGGRRDDSGGGNQRQGSPAPQRGQAPPQQPQGQPPQDQGSPDNGPPPGNDGPPTDDFDIEDEKIPF